jgi:hypothetical protein
MVFRILNISFNGFIWISTAFHGSYRRQEIKELHNKDRTKTDCGVTDNLLILLIIGTTENPKEPSRTVG